MYIYIYIHIFCIHVYIWGLRASPEFGFRANAWTILGHFMALDSLCMRASQRLGETHMIMRCYF